VRDARSRSKPRSVIHGTTNYHHNRNNKQLSTYVQLAAARRDTHNV
jgi:hypothetical protein